MTDAIPENVKKQEAQQKFTSAAESSFEQYKVTCLHINLDEFSQWVDKVQETLNPRSLNATCQSSQGIRHCRSMQLC